MHRENVNKTVTRYSAHSKSNERHYRVQSAVLPLRPRQSHHNQNGFLSLCSVSIYLLLLYYCWFFFLLVFAVTVFLGRPFVFRSGSENVFNCRPSVEQWGICYRYFRD